MLFKTHPKEIILQQLKKFKPLKYNKFYWWRRYSNEAEGITKRHSIEDKIKAGYYDFPASFWDAQLCLVEMNEETNRIILQNLLKIFLEKKENVSAEIREQFLREVIIFIKHIQKQEELLNTQNFHKIGKF